MSSNKETSNKEFICNWVTFQISHWLNIKKKTHTHLEWEKIIKINPHNGAINLNLLQEISSLYNNT